ncbi:MAG: hypothetical protein FWD13_06485 [Treponema sp.]|nr:hypothetical protein [Treponema sp.]
MKTNAKIVCFILLFLTVFYASYASGIYDKYNYSSLGIVTGNRHADLFIAERGSNILSYEIASTTGGVIFQEIAVPAGNAIGQPVNITYDPSQPNGWRLSVSIGNTTTTANLYDWEFIPVIHFVESNYTACMTLYDNHRSPEERILKQNRPQSIYFANFHPAFGDTLIGLNLFFVDALLMNIPLMQNTDEAFDFPIPGYHDHATWRNKQDNSQNIDQIMSIFNIFERQNSYIFTDYGTEISYHIENSEIVFSGVPKYIFLYNDDDSKTVTVLEESYIYMNDLRNVLYEINPTIYRSAEKTAQWAAFFRMVQTEYPEIWQDLLIQIEGKRPSPLFETPRYWLRRTR